jgi:hypothetical protein
VTDSTAWLSVRKFGIGTLESPGETWGFFVGSLHGYGTLFDAGSLGDQGSLNFDGSLGA